MTLEEILSLGAMLGREVLSIGAGDTLKFWKVCLSLVVVGGLLQYLRWLGLLSSYSRGSQIPLGGSSLVVVGIPFICCAGLFSMHSVQGLLSSGGGFSQLQCGGLFLAAMHWWATI